MKRASILLLLIMFCAWWNIVTARPKPSVVAIIHEGDEYENPYYDQGGVRRYFDNNLAMYVALGSLVPAFFQQVVFVPTCAGDATADTTRFNAIKSTIGVTNLGTIRLPYKSDPSQRCKLNTFATGSNITIDNTDGSGIFVVTGQTVTLGPVINSPEKQIFYNALSGQGTASLAVTSTVYLEWWGGAADGATDNTAIWNAANITTTRLHLNSGTYLINSNPDAPIWQEIVGNGSDVYSGGTVLKAGASVTQLVTLGTNGTADVRNVRVDGAKTNGAIGIYAGFTGWTGSLTNVYVTRWSGTGGLGMRIGDVVGMNIYGIRMDDGRSHCAITSATNANPVALTCDQAHRMDTGDKVTLKGGTGGWTAINGTFTVTITGSTTFTIPVNSTSLGGLAGTVLMRNGNNINVLMQGRSSEAYPTTVRFFGGYLSTAQTKGLYVVSALNCSSYNLVAESNEEEGVYLRPNLGDITQLNQYDLHLEDNNGNSASNYQFAAIGANGRTVTFQATNPYSAPTGSTKSFLMDASGGPVAAFKIDFPQIPNTSGQISAINGAYGSLANLPSNLTYTTVINDPLGNLRSFPDVLLAAWSSWTPTYSSNVGDATFTFASSVTTVEARYRIVGKTLDLTLNFSGTLKVLSPAPATIRFTMPPGAVPLASDGVTAPAEVGDNGVTGRGEVQFVASGPSPGGYCQKTPLSNFTSATLVSCHVTATIPIQ